MHAHYYIINITGLETPAVHKSYSTLISYSFPTETARHDSVSWYLQVGSSASIISSYFFASCSMETALPRHKVRKGAKWNYRRKLLGNVEELEETCGSDYIHLEHGSGMLSKVYKDHLSETVCLEYLFPSSQCRVRGPSLLSFFRSARKDGHCRQWHGWGGKKRKEAHAQRSDTHESCVCMLLASALSLPAVNQLIEVNVLIIWHMAYANAKSVLYGTTFLIVI